MSYFIGTVLTRLHSGYRSLAMRSLLTLPVDHLTAPAPHLDYFLLASGKERAKKKRMSLVILVRIKFTFLF